jgi:hypothetical protein
VLENVLTPLDNWGTAQNRRDARSQHLSLLLKFSAVALILLSALGCGDGLSAVRPWFSPLEILVKAKSRPPDRYGVRGLGTGTILVLVNELGFHVVYGCLFLFTPLRAECWHFTVTPLNPKSTCYLKVVKDTILVDRISDHAGSLLVPLNL